MLFVLNIHRYVSPVGFQLVLLSEHSSWFWLWMVCHCGGVTTNKPLFTLFWHWESVFSGLLFCVVLITLFRSSNPSSFWKTKCIIFPLLWKRYKSGLDFIYRSLLIPRWQQKRWRTPGLANSPCPRYIYPSLCRKPWQEKKDLPGGIRR